MRKKFSNLGALVGLLALTFLALSCQTIGVNKNDTMMDGTANEMAIKDCACTKEDNNPCSCQHDESPCTCGGGDLVANCNDDGCGGDL
jgi:hypothetical protein